MVRPSSSGLEGPILVGLQCTHPTEGGEPSMDI